MQDSSGSMWTEHVPDCYMALSRVWFPIRPTEDTEQWNTKYLFTVNFIVVITPLRIG